MKAVIIAAGEGSRLHPYTDKRPKALVPLLGLALTERVILSAAEAGIKEFIMVTGYMKGAIEKAFEQGDRYGVSISYIYNPEWKRANGISVLAAEKLIGPGEKFVVLMCDHLFDPGNLSSLLEFDIQDDECVLCVDKNLSGVHDMPDATKVAVDEKGFIREIDKKLSSYNAVDCGMFLCSHSIFDALREALSEGRDALTDGVRVLAERGKMKAHDINGAFWLDVDDRESFLYAKKKLLAALPNPKEGVVSRHLNRKVSLLITKYISPTSLTPNQLSFVSFIVGLVATVLFALRHPLAAGLVTQASSILDGVDGEIARLKMKKSHFGDFADSVFDRYVDGFLILAMTYAVYLSTGSIYTWVLGWVALVGSTMSSFYKEKYKAATGESYVSQRYDGLMKFSLAGRDSRLFLIMLGGIFNRVDIVLWLIAVPSNLLALYRFFVFRRLLDRKGV